MASMRHSPTSRVLYTFSIFAALTAVVLYNFKCEVYQTPWAVLSSHLHLGSPLTAERWDHMQVLTHQLPDDLLPGYFEGVRGVKVAKDFGPGETILTIPKTATIAIHTFSERQAVIPLVSSSTWLSREDGDMFLEVLALLYEVLVKAGNSTWYPYFASLPASYSLPVNYSDADWAQTLLKELPELHRLVQKRKASLAEFFPIIKSALCALPGGQHALASWSKPQLWQAYMWAYGAARTRTVTVALPSSHPLANLVPDVGAMVPVLDLVNHEAAAKAAAQIDTTGESILLVAVRNVRKGEQLTFPYVDEGDTPACAYRWLLEYGFIPQASQHSPAADCMAWRITSLDLSKLLSSSDDWGISDNARVHLLGMERRIEETRGIDCSVNGKGEGVKETVEQLEVLIGEKTVAVKVFEAAVLERKERLGSALALAEKLLGLGEEGMGKKSTVTADRQMEWLDLLEVGRGALRALDVASGFVNQFGPAL